MTQKSHVGGMVGGCSVVRVTVETTLETHMIESLKPVHNIGKFKKYKGSQIYTKLTWFKDGHGGKLPLKYFLMKFYSF